MARVRITDIVIPTSEVALGEQSFEVKPLTLVDFSTLIQKHRDKLALIYARGRGIDFAYLAEVAPAMLDDMVAMATRTYGTDDYEAAVAKIQELPIATKGEALAEIWRISVPDEKKIEQYLSAAAGLLRGASKTLAANASKIKDSATEKSAS